MTLLCAELNPLQNLKDIIKIFKFSILKKFKNFFDL